MSMRTDVCGHAAVIICQLDHVHFCRIVDFCNSLPEAKQQPLRYEISSTLAIADNIEEIVTAKSATVSIAGSHGTFAVQQAQQETQSRLQTLEASLSDIKHLLVQSRDASTSDGQLSRVPQVQCWPASFSRM
jgi:hypothetical protein